MPKETDHISLANKNHDAMMRLGQDLDRFSEWVAVTAFYKALQIIEAMFVNQHGRCCFGHHQRLEKLKKGGYKELYKHFRALWSAASIARYLYDSETRQGYSSFADYLSAEKVKSILLKRRLHAVECNAVSLLSERGRELLVRLPADF